MMDIDVSLKNPGDFKGTFALLLEVAIRDLLSDDDSFDANIETDELGSVLTEVLGLESGIVKTSHGDVSLIDITVFEF